MSLPYTNIAGIITALSIATPAIASENTSDIASLVKAKATEIERTVAERVSASEENSVEEWQRVTGEPIAVAMTRPGVSFNSVAARHVQWANTVSINIDANCDFSPLEAAVGEVEACIGALNSIAGFNNTGLTSEERTELREFGAQMMRDLSAG